MLLLFGGDFEPMLQDRQVLGWHFEESDTRAHVGLRVNDFPLRLEQLFVGPDLQQYGGAHGEGIHHVQVAAVQTQFADAGSDAHFGFFFKKLRAGKKDIPRRTPAFAFHCASWLGMVCPSILARFHAAMPHGCPERYCQMVQPFPLIRSSSLSLPTSRPAPRRGSSGPGSDYPASSEFP